MSNLEAMVDIERDFVRVFESISEREYQLNRKLRDKTRKVAGLLSKIAKVRRPLTGEPASASNEEGTPS